MLSDRREDEILVQRCRRQNFRVKANSGMAGTPEIFIIFQIVADLLNNCEADYLYEGLSWGLFNFGLFPVKIQ